MLWTDDRPHPNSLRGLGRNNRPIPPPASSSTPPPVVARYPADNINDRSNSNGNPIRTAIPVSNPSSASNVSSPIYNADGSIYLGKTA